MRRGLIVLVVPLVVSTAIVVACSSFAEDGVTTTDVEGGSEASAPNTCVAAPASGPPKLGLTGCNGKMLDVASNPMSCGACGASCAPNHACAKGMCASDIVVTSSTYPKLGALTNGFLFFTQQDPNSSTTGLLQRHDLATGLTKQASSHPRGIKGITSDESRTYIVEQDGFASAIGSDGTTQYYFNGGAGQSIGIPIAASHGALGYVDGSGQLRALNASGDLGVFSAPSPTLTSLTLDGTAAYWSTVVDSASGKPLLGRAELSNTGITLKPMDDSSGALTTDDSFLYFYGASKGEFRRIAKDLQSPSELIATWKGSNASNAGFLLVDSTNLYALLGSPFGSIAVKMPKCGGPPRQIAPEDGVTLYGDGRLAVDGQYLYFTANDGSIRRIPK